jgi:hypothetical protein
MLERLLVKWWSELDSNVQRYDPEPWPHPYSACLYWNEQQGSKKLRSALLQYPVGSICNYSITPGSLNRFSACSSVPSEQHWCSWQRIGATEWQRCWPSFRRCPIQASIKISYNPNKGFHCSLQTLMKYVLTWAKSASFRTVCNILFTVRHFNLDCWVSSPSRFELHLTVDRAAFVAGEWLFSK